MTIDYFPFQRLGLERNPFCALDEAEWSYQAWLHPQLEKYLKNLKSIIQILGDAGTGKTSALLALKRELEQRGRKVSYIYLPPDQRPPRFSIEENTVLLVDEIERLPTRKRQALIRSALSDNATGLRLAFSSHLNLQLELPGLAPDQLPTLPLPSITSTQLETLLNDRIRAVSRSETLPVWVTHSAAEELLKRYLGDLRSVERVLYDLFQVLDEVGAVDRSRIKHMFSVIGEPTEPG